MLACCLTDGVQSLAPCVNISWNLAPFCPVQYIGAFFTQRPIIPMHSITRRAVGIDALPLDATLLSAMQHVLQRDLDEDAAVRARGYAMNATTEGNSLCKCCGEDVGNVFFMTNPSTIYCVACRDRLVEPIEAARKSDSSSNNTRGLGDEDMDVAADDEPLSDRAIRTLVPRTFTAEERPSLLLTTAFFFRPQDELRALVTRAKARRDALASHDTFLHTARLWCAIACTGTQSPVSMAQFWGVQE